MLLAPCGASQPPVRVPAGRRSWRPLGAFGPFGLEGTRPSTLRTPPRRVRTRAASAASAAALSVLVVGGSGRVGGSTARWLQRLSQQEGLDLRVAVGGRSRENFAAWRRRVADAGELGEVEFVEIDHSREESVEQALRETDWSLLLHTAGPFQGITQPTILKQAIRAGVPYVDVCDDTELCKAAKALTSQAKEAKVPAVVSAGIWPGESWLIGSFVGASQLILTTCAPSGASRFGRFLTLPLIVFFGSSGLCADGL